MHPEKTFSAQQSYHEMLVRMQTQSPALTYVVCKLIMDSTQVEVHDWIGRGDNPINRVLPFTDTEAIDCQSFEGFGVYTSRVVEFCELTTFVNRIFSGNVVRVVRLDTNWKLKLRTDITFVEWLKSGVVTMDDTAKLLTINQ